MTSSPRTSFAVVDEPRRNHQFSIFEAILNALVGYLGKIPAFLLLKQLRLTYPYIVLTYFIFIQMLSSYAAIDSMRSTG